MKKLMIAVGAMFSAVAVNAAAINWSIESAYEPGSEDDMGAGYYAFIIADTGIGASATYGRDLAVAALETGDASFINTYALADGATFDWGYATQTNVGSFDNSQTVKAYAVILNAEKVTDATKAYITELGSTDITGMGFGAPIEFGDISEATGDVNNWYAVGAPEPTSGLLLLLGMAGLALRRKQK